MALFIQIFEKGIRCVLYCFRGQKLKRVDLAQDKNLPNTNSQQLVPLTRGSSSALETVRELVTLPLLLPSPLPVQTHRPSGSEGSVLDLTLFNNHYELASVRTRDSAFSSWTGPVLCMGIEETLFSDEVSISVWLVSVKRQFKQENIRL